MRVINVVAPQSLKDRYERDGDQLINALKSRTPIQAAAFVKSKIQAGIITRDDVLEKLVMVVTYLLRNE
jgi:hypothetical protein